MGAAARQRQELEQDLSLALAAGQFTLHYQSRVAVGSGEITGFEALVRWNHPERGLIAPGAFIAVAEESGLITRLGEWVLYEACRAAAAWPDPIGVSVNVSPVQLRNAALFKVVTGALAASGLAPDRLELEVTETAMLNDSGAVLPVMRRLRALGVRIVPDDFGTGFSSLTPRHGFLFDGIKIDRSFIQDLEHEPKSLARGDRFGREPEHPGDRRGCGNAGSARDSGAGAMPAGAGVPVQPAGRRRRRSACRGRRAAWPRA